ncbi:condensation domain-containing protein [Photorhabdus bodei]|uniref:Condensation domain-containing protein n=1 Tax=Photorhabdus bodei TaxID=2029681 RepID=A0AAW6BND5_9GAMM|nr:condensation domain-containing protein [Photorhabdus bodei]MDB6374942.1 condensation domain-containing protein [Photorhabdus bodei]
MKVNIAPLQYCLLENEKVFLARQNNIGIIYELPNDVSDLQVKMAVLGVFDVFPILKSKFNKISGEWNVDFNINDFSLYFSEIECHENKRVMDVAHRVLRNYEYHLNISEGPLVRFLLIKKNMKYNLLFLGNHLVYDKISLRNIESCIWKLLYNKKHSLPNCRFIDWTAEVNHYLHNNFYKDTSYWLNTDWSKSVHLPVFQYIEPEPATRKSWKVQFSHSASQYLLSLIGTSVTLIDLLLAKLNLAVSEFMSSSSSLSVDLWDNGRNFLKDRYSVGPHASFWPILINKSSGSLFESAKKIAQIRATAPPKYGYLLGCFKGRNEHERRLFESIPTPQFKVDFLGHFSGKHSNTKKISRVTKLPSCIPIDHSAYSHISIIFYVENNIITMNWAHSSVAHKEDDLKQIAQIMIDMSL